MPDSNSSQQQPIHRPIYVTDRGDLFEFQFDAAGSLVQIRVAPNNVASASYPISMEELPPSVLLQYENQLIDRLSKRNRRQREESFQDHDDTFER